MPLNNEGPGGEDRASDGEASPGRCDSLASASDTDCSRESFTSDPRSRPSSPPCERPAMGCRGSAGRGEGSPPPSPSSRCCAPTARPPRTVTLEDVMASGRELSNLTLAHEIIVNRDFRAAPPKLAQNSLEKLVRDTMHRAYWDVLTSELSEHPPKYGHAIKLLEEVKEILLSFLNPGANRMRTQIREVLDMELIGQQADRDAVDIAGLACYVTSTMAKLCAPVRDEEVRRLQESGGDVVSLFREIFRVLDLMKMDVLNFTIQGLRPELQRQSVEYERAKFQNILDRTPSALDNTSAWIREALEELLGGPTPTQPSKGPGALPGPFLVMDTAFLQILCWEPDRGRFPETLMADEGRLRALQRELRGLQLVAQVLLIVNSAVGGAVHGRAPLAQRLKALTFVLLDGMHSPGSDPQACLGAACQKIFCELSGALAERGHPALPPALQATLTGQVCSVAQEGNPVRRLVEERVRQYFMALLTAQKPWVKPGRAPAGLTSVQPELEALAARFMALVDFNRRVYGPFYSRVLKKLMFDNAASPLPPPPPPAPPAAPAAAGPTEGRANPPTASPS